MSTAALFPPSTCDRCPVPAPIATASVIHRHGRTWAIVTDFRVYGTPKGQPRPRAFAKKMGGTFVARVYDAKTAEGWKSDIAMAARAYLPEILPAIVAGVPALVDIEFIFPRPQCLSRKKDPEGRIPHTGKPDRDNLDKAVLDCMTCIGFFADDAQVCGGDLSKWYAAKGERPGASIRLYRLEEGGQS